MAANLRKYKYDGLANTKPGSTNSPSVKSSSGSPQSPPAPEGAAMDIEPIKADIITALRKDLASVIREELKRALADDFESLKTEIQAMRTEITTNIATVSADINRVKTQVKDMEEGLSTWSEEVVSVQTTVTDLQKLVEELRGKCDDMEGRMRRGNIRITGVPELAGSSSPTAVSKLLKDVLHLEKEVRVERSHRALTQRKPGDKPRVIIAKMHNEGDAQDILRKARDRGGQLNLNGNPIAIFPDFTASVAKARAAFTDVRKMLRGRPDVALVSCFLLDSASHLKTRKESLWMLLKPWTM